MKLHNSTTAFLLLLLEVYGVFSTAIQLKPNSTLDIKEILKGFNSSLSSLKNTLPSFLSSKILEERPHRFSLIGPNPFLHLSCRHPWVLVGRTCLFVDLSRSTSWQEGRNFCKGLHKGSDLVVFRDANEFSETLRHVKTINSSKKKIHFWVGGSDVEKNNEWLWITGNPMPMGSPFWGVSASEASEPHANNGEYCAFLNFNNRYYLHDASCEGWSGNQISPLCQYNPVSY